MAIIEILDVSLTKTVFDVSANVHPHEATPLTTGASPERLFASGPRGSVGKIYFSGLID